MATYLDQLVSLRDDRRLLHCRRHIETPLHLTQCSDATSEESEAWVQQLVEDKKLVLDGGWFFLGASVFCNPRYFLTPTYFPSKELAEEFLNEFSQAQYEVKLCWTDRK